MWLLKAVNRHRNIQNRDRHRAITAPTGRVPHIPKVRVAAQTEATRLRQDLRTEAKATVLQPEAGAAVQELTAAAVHPAEVLVQV